MKLVLSSQGFTTLEIANAVSELVNKPLEQINIAIINEAYVAIPGGKDKRWIINELLRISDYIGGNIDFINIRAYNSKEIRERLFYADIVYIVGGKQFILPELFKQTGFDEVLKEFAKEKVVMGTSAGAMTLGRQIDANEYWKQRYGIMKQEIKEETLGLVNFNIIPHYLRKDHKKWDKQFYDSVLRDNSFVVYAITDTQAVIYEDGNISFVGGIPEIFK